MILDAAEIGLELVLLGHRGYALAHGQQLHRSALGPVTQLVQPLDALGDGLEVGEQTTQPALVDVRHAAGLRGLLDRVAGLLLRAHEQHGAAASREVAGEFLGVVQQTVGLLQVDDVDAVALAEDEAAHLGVPAARLVAEVDPGLQQLSDTDLGGQKVLPCSAAVGLAAHRPARGPGLSFIPGRAA